jgi:hypothetical protein
MRQASNSDKHQTSLKIETSIKPQAWPLNIHTAAAILAHPHPHAQHFLNKLDLNGVVFLCTVHV